MKNDYYGKNHMLHILGNIPVDACPPPWSKFFQFHAVFVEIWQNCMLATPPRGLAPPPRQILDPPLYSML